MLWRGGREGSAPSVLWYGSHQPSDEALRAIMRGAREGGGERERQRERRLNVFVNQ